jgi:Domain of unknown function (DUF4468) with TBP-like fold
VLLCSLLMSSCMKHSTPLPPFEIHKVIELKGIGKEEIYKRAKIWVAKNFVSAQDVIQYDESDHSDIIIKGNIAYDAPAFNPGTNYTGVFRLTFSISFKDGKYKYDITNVEHKSFLKGFSVGTIPTRTKKKISVVAIKDVTAFANTFEADMYQKINEKW